MVTLANVDAVDIVSLDYLYPKLMYRMPQQFSVLKSMMMMMMMMMMNFKGKLASRSAKVILVL